jgi:hypothetical protein
VLVVPELRGDYRRVLLERWRSVRRLVEAARHVRGVDLAVVVTDRGDLSWVSVAAVLGDDALLLVAEAGEWAAPFLRARPWVPVVVITAAGGLVVFALTPAAS